MPTLHQLAAAPPSLSTARVLIDAVYFLGLSVAAGAGLVLALVAPIDRGGEVVAAVRRRVPWVIGIVVVTAVLQFVERAARSAKSGIGQAFSRRALADFIHVRPAPGQHLGIGAIASIQMVAYVLLVAALCRLAVRGARAAAWAVLASSVLTVALPYLPFGPVTADTVAKAVLSIAHVTAVLVWVGGLAVLALAGMSARRAVEPDAERVAAWHRAWARFSGVALYAVGTLIVSGAWLTWTHIGTPAQMVTTPYGRHLTVKLVMVAGMLIVGAYNSRVLLPGIAAARARDDRTTAVRLALRRFPIAVAVEALLAVGVLLVVPFLAGSGRTQAGWPLARAFDLTVFGTGVLLVALVAAALWAGGRATRSHDREERVTF